MIMQTRKDIARQLQNAAAGHTLQELSNTTGIDKGNISKMLNGLTNVGIDNIIKLANSLDVKINIK